MHVATGTGGALPLAGRAPKEPPAFPGQAGQPDGGMNDGGTNDGGTSNGGTSDSGTSNGGTSDSGTSNGGTSDSGSAGVPIDESAGAPTEGVGGASGQGSSGSAGSPEGRACSSPVGEYEACTGSCGCLPKSQRPEITPESAINECGDVTPDSINGVIVFAWGESADLSADGTKLTWMDGSVWVRSCDE